MSETKHQLLKHKL